MPTADASSASASFEVRVRVRPPDREVTVRGELDADSCPELDGALGDPTVGGTTELDLSGVTFMDSAGLRCLVRAFRHHADAGASLRLGAESPQVRRLLAMTGLYETLQRGKA